MTRLLRARPLIIQGGVRGATTQIFSGMKIFGPKLGQFFSSIFTIKQKWTKINGADWRGKGGRVIINFWGMLTGREGVCVYSHVFLGDGALKYSLIERKLDLGVGMVVVVWA